MTKFAILTLNLFDYPTKIVYNEFVCKCKIWVKFATMLFKVFLGQIQSTNILKGGRKWQHKRFLRDMKKNFY